MAESSHKSTGRNVEAGDEAGRLLETEMLNETDVPVDYSSPLAKRVETDQSDNVPADLKKSATCVVDPKELSKREFDSRKAATRSLDSREPAMGPTDSKEITVEAVDSNVPETKTVDLNEPANLDVYSKKPDASSRNFDPNVVEVMLDKETSSGVPAKYPIMHSLLKSVKEIIADASKNLTESEDSQSSKRERKVKINKKRKISEAPEKDLFAGIPYAQEGMFQNVPAEHAEMFSDIPVARSRQFSKTKSSVETDAKGSAPFDDNTRRELRTQLAKTNELLKCAEDTKRVLKDLKELGEMTAEEEKTKREFFKTCKHLLKCIDIHVKEIADLEKRRNLRAAEENEAEPEREVVPWAWIKKLSQLFQHLAAKEGITVSPDQVKDTINANVLLEEYIKYLDKREGYFESIEIKKCELKKKLKEADSYMLEIRELRDLHNDVGYEAIIKEDLLEWNATFRSMANECSDYLTTMHKLISHVLTAFNKYCSGNNTWQWNIEDFLKLKMDLFGNIEDQSP